MDTRDIAALMKGMAPAVRDFVAASMRPLVARIEELEQALEAERAKTHTDSIAAAVAEAFAALPSPVPGKDADPAEVAEIVRGMIADDLAEVARAVNDIPVAPELPDIPALIGEAVSEAVAAIPTPVPGKDADPEATAALVRAEVERAVSELPPPKDGDSVTLEDVAPVIEQEVARAVAALPPAEPGKEGPPGRLPIVKEWTDEVAYQGDVRTHGGSTYQATKDTAKEPPHEDWHCIAAAGRDARQIVVRETYDPDGSYAALNIVALNGAAFMARKDEPGPCPGDGWQMVAMQGKQGKPGPKGDKGDKGEPGKVVTASVSAAMVTADGVQTIVNADGTEVECDFYPVLSKLGG